MITNFDSQVAGALFMHSARESDISSASYMVADISLADYGRKEINIAEHEMPGLMTIREKFADSRFLVSKYKDMIMAFSFIKTLVNNNN